MALIKLFGMLKGVLGFLVSKCLGFLFCWFLGFKFHGYLASKLLGFKVSWFQSFLVSKFEDLPNFHFMFSGRYWSHIQDFQEFVRRIVGICRSPSFPTFSKCSISKSLTFIKIRFPWRTCFFLDFQKYPGVSKDK